jgi:hypothetical protein
MLRARIALASVRRSGVPACLAVCGIVSRVRAAGGPFLVLCPAALAGAGALEERRIFQGFAGSRKQTRAPQQPFPAGA